MVIRKKNLVVNSVLSIKVADHGYVLAQLRDNCRMDVFDNLRCNDYWEGEDLNVTNVLFTIVVADHRILNLFNSEVTSQVIINQRPRPLINLMMNGQRRKSTNLPGLSLIKHGEIFDPTDIETLIPMLEPDIHRDILYSYEDIRMIGQSEDIRERIITYYETGVNWDKGKKILYPDLDPPESGYERVKYFMP